MTPVGDLDERPRCVRRSSGFVGDIEQVPSAVSAIKVDGRRAYERVRAGEDVTLAARPVTVHAHRRASGHPARRTRRTSSTWRSRCAAPAAPTSGRSPATSAPALGVGGHLTALRRTAVGAATLAEATPLETMQETGEVPLMSLADAARRFFPVLQVDADQERAVGFGRRLDVELPPELAAADLRGARARTASCWRSTSVSRDRLRRPTGRGAGPERMSRCG